MLPERGRAYSVARRGEVARQLKMIDRGSINRTAGDQRIGSDEVNRLCLCGGKSGHGGAGRVAGEAPITSVEARALRRLEQLGGEPPGDLQGREQLGRGDGEHRPQHHLVEAPTEHCRRLQHLPLIGRHHVERRADRAARRRAEAWLTEVHRALAVHQQPTVIEPREQPQGDRGQAARLLVHVLRQPRTGHRTQGDAEQALHPGLRQRRHRDGLEPGELRVVDRGRGEPDDQLA